jgi:hypothetical protein
MIKVLKPFTTRTRRIAADDTIAATDDLFPHTIETLLERKFIEAPKAETKRKGRRGDDTAETVETASTGQ